MEIIWIIVCLIEAFIHYRIIKSGKSPKHSLAGLFHIILGLSMGAIYYQLGFYLYWIAPYIIFTHLLIFNEGLNLMRGKPLGYLDIPDDPEEDSIIDGIIKKYIGEFMWLRIRIFLFIVSISLMLYYGDTTTWSILQGR